MKNLTISFAPNRFFLSSLPVLLSSLPRYSGGLTISGSLHILASGNLRATLSCVRVLSQSCPEVARVGFIELRIRVWTNFFRQCNPFTLMGFVSTTALHSSGFRDLWKFQHFSKPWCQTFLRIYVSKLEKDLAYSEFRTTVPWSRNFTKQALYHLS